MGSHVVASASNSHTPGVTVCCTWQGDAFTHFAEEIFRSYRQTKLSIQSVNHTVSDSVLRPVSNILMLQLYAEVYLTLIYK